MSLVERIEDKCEPIPDTGCWLFTGRLNDSGYPMVGNRRAHRVVLAEKLKRPLLRSEQALHSCDVRACCAPDHLAPGTNLENVRDKCAKGRQGRVHGPRKLKSLREANAIRRARASGASVVEIADKKKLSRRQVQRILKGERWAPRACREPAALEASAS